MVKERAEWEKYRERLVRQVKDFQKAKVVFAEEKTKFESDKKSEEWGHEGLRGKLRAAEELLSKERADWKEVCKKDNQCLYASRAKITDLKAQNATLTKKVEDIEADKERIEAELKAQVGSRDKDFHAKDMANSILNASELDAAVAALIDASRAVGHCGGYLECAQHVEEAFGQEFDVSHCSVTDQADTALARTKEVYDHLSLPVMDLVAETLKHDNWCQRLKTILDPPQTVELSDEEEAAGGGGDGDGGDGYE
ncbi:hypothetical protein HanRHA438_Chr05g0235401 [Helianthus annuus]|uniref:Uncharacterized protein n=1 Tax=Helianthus annuus TaxID=4232 RepID=A0A9K3J141_HELAN|nr:hypothetical protein HanXRQr2_Chr05g0226381 [Helianthus annuus]KAJ0585406.1 hypothetical protein HanHA89_Chr05g0199971 [Helianthus annuus]KAJ0919942.1 hypothetical protein HanRHA438_Chr05g0235401 [Helianthus annuus]KAJ0923644.1 hypothetical protein HanPSC8_Chr05g0218471 [Helianthus annuus]